MYDTLDSSPLEKVKLFWQRFQHKLFVYFLKMYHIECFWGIAYLKQTWEELQLYLSDHARQFLNLGYLNFQTFINCNQLQDEDSSEDGFSEEDDFPDLI